MKELMVNIGSVTAALLASLCCIGPIALAALGLGGAGLLVGLDAYRPLMMGVAFLMLGAAFFLTFRKREEICEDGSCKRIKSSKSSRISLWIITVLVLTFLTVPYIDFGQLSVAAVDDNRLNTSVTLDVGGMSCTSCNVAVEIAVGKLEGVSSVKADHRLGSVAIRYDDGRISPGEIAEAINHLGYRVNLQPRSPE